MSKIWFCCDCEWELSQIKDLCPICNEMYCPESEDYINEVTMHKQQGCKVVYIEPEWIKTTTLFIKTADGNRPATTADLEQTFLNAGVLPNFAYALARITPLQHKYVYHEKHG